MEAGESERVLYVVEEVSELARLRPAMQPLPERAKDGCEVGERPYLGGQLVDSFDGGEECFFVVGRQSIAPTGFYEYPDKQVQKVHVLGCRHK